MSTPLYVDYIELGVTDATAMAAARTFYSEAFGWQFTDYGPDYIAIRSADGEGEVGGLNSEAAPAAAGPLLLIRTGDLEAAHAAVLGAEGEIVDAPSDYPGGRRFTSLDPSGNVLGVYQPAP